MSHELEDNKERRRHILAKMRQHSNGLPHQKLVAMIMDEFGYNLRGAKEKVKELSYMGYIKERNLYWFDAETLAHSDELKRERKVKGETRKCARG
jgi:polysaccharide deacetylase 2 family uncharacterized protein YibQ